MNQSLLLADLYESRECNRLLEPEDDEDLEWSEWDTDSQKQKDGKTRRSTNNDDEKIPLEANLKLPPGKFACSKVWEKDFLLHPRLRECTPQGIRGLLAIRMVLNSFSVVGNRKNMFVYQDDSKNIFYFKVDTERSGAAPHLAGQQQNDLSATASQRDGSEDMFGGISRTSSISSATRSSAFERLQAVGGALAAGPDKIVFKVFGIDDVPVGSSIRKDLVSMLQRKLDEKLVEILSTLLQRNTMCKLSPEDVHFLQPPRSLPNQIIRLMLNSTVVSYLEAFQYYLRQNLVSQLMIMPKYASSRLENRFQDSVDGVDIPVADIFLYNKCHSGGGRRGMGCLTMAVVDGHGGLLHRSRKLASAEFATNLDGALKLDTLREMVDVKRLDPDDLVDEDSLVLQVRVWEQGRVDVGEVMDKLQAVVKHALWELVTEFFLLPKDFTTSQTLPYVMSAGGRNYTAEVLSTDYKEFAKDWVEIGLKMDVTSVNKSEVEFMANYAPVNAKKELQHQISLAVNDVKTKSFQMGSFRCSNAASLF